MSAADPASAVDSLLPEFRLCTATLCICTCMLRLHVSLQCMHAGACGPGGHPGQACMWGSPHCSTLLPTAAVPSTPRQPRAVGPAWPVVENRGGQHGPVCGRWSCDLLPSCSSTFGEAAVSPQESARCLPILHAMSRRGASSREDGCGEVARSMAGFAWEHPRQCMSGPCMRGPHAGTHTPWHTPTHAHARSSLFLWCCPPHRLYNTITRTHSQPRVHMPRTKRGTRNSPTHPHSRCACAFPGRCYRPLQPPSGCAQGSRRVPGSQRAVGPPEGDRSHRRPPHCRPAVRCQSPLSPCGLHTSTSDLNQGHSPEPQPWWRSVDAVNTLMTQCAGIYSPVITR